MFHSQDNGAHTWYQPEFAVCTLCDVRARSEDLWWLSWEATWGCFCVVPVCNGCKEARSNVNNDALIIEAKRHLGRYLMGEVSLADMAAAEMDTDNASSSSLHTVSS